MKKVSIILIFSILLVAVILLGTSYCLTQIRVEKFLSMSQSNGKIIAFDTLFIQKVLKAQGEVSSEDRLRLENAVYETGDTQIVEEWHLFLASQTEEEAQSRALELLTMLSSKIVY